MFCDIGYARLCMEEVTSLPVCLRIVLLVMSLVYRKPISLLEAMVSLEHLMKCFKATVV